MEDVKDNIETAVIRNEQEVLAARERVEELTEIQFLPGLEEEVGFFPKLENLPGRPVLARFSYGLKAPNMSSVFLDKSKGETAEDGIRNTNQFLTEQGFTGPVIQILGKFIPTDQEIASGQAKPVEEQIEEVDLDTANKEHRAKIFGNMIFTRDFGVTLMIKPADCPVGIIYCKDRDGNPMLAIDHAGADAENAGMTAEGLWQLHLQYGVDLSKAIVVVFPGVSQEHFSISRQWKVGNEIKERENGIVEKNWGPFITPKKTDDPFEQRQVDIPRTFEIQAIRAGVKPENIQLYLVDTYADAEKGRAYSRRYSNEHDRAHDGGQILAVQLNSEFFPEPPKASK